MSELYYTKIPQGIKSGSKFEIISATGYDDSKWLFPGWEIGDIVIVKSDVKSKEPSFQHEKSGQTRFLNWGCVRPIDMRYKVGDVVKLNGKDNSCPSWLSSYKTKSNKANIEGSTKMKENRGVILDITDGDVYWIEYVDKDGNKPCLPYKSTSFELLEPEVVMYKAGDWVRLINKNFYSHNSLMDQYKNTVQQIKGISSQSPKYFELEGIPKWAFHPTDFEEKVPEPVKSKTSDLLPVGTIVRLNAKGKMEYSDNKINPHNETGEIIESNTTNFFPYRVKWKNGSNAYNKDEIEEVVDNKFNNFGFNVGDEVWYTDKAVKELIKSPEQNVKFVITRITDKYDKFGVIVETDNGALTINTHWLQKKENSSINKTNLNLQQDGSKSSKSNTGSNSLVFHPVSPTICWGTVGGGETLLCPAEEIRVGS